MLKLQKEGGVGAVKQKGIIANVSQVGQNANAIDDKENPFGYRLINFIEPKIKGKNEKKDINHVEIHQRRRIKPEASYKY